MQRADGTITVHSACAGKGQKNRYGHSLTGGAGKLSVVPRPHASCPGLPMPSSASVGSASHQLACSVTVFPTTAWVEWQQRGEGIPCLQPVFSTEIQAPSHPRQVPQVCRASSACPSWHPSPLSGGTENTGSPGPQGTRLAGAKGRRAEVFMLLQAARLSAGAQVLTSPGIPAVSVEVQGSCRYTCACSRGLSERG